VAHVGDAVVTREQLDETVEHFREEAQREGKEFPDEGDPGFRRARAQLLGLLVYRAELSQEAKRLGVRVEDDEVERRLAEGGSEEEGDAKEGFARDSVRSQLELEGIAREINRGVTDAAARNEKLRAFLGRMRRTYAGRIRYEPGYAPPGS
jgi:hypothetical protein